MALGLNQPLTEMSTRNISWGGKGGWCVGLTTLPLHVPNVMKYGSLNIMEPRGPVQAYNRIALPLPLRTVVGENLGDCGGTVVKALCYKSEGRWFNPRWCHWNFSLT